MTTLGTQASTLTGEGRVMAVTYQRVSTKEQATTGGRDEGFSIPAQREANRRKADALSAEVVAEFVDAGESARSAKRPELQRMLDYIATHQVTYCIVHKVDRLARNRLDDVDIHRQLIDAGVQLAPRPRTSTRPRRGCCCTASCPRLRSSTPATSPPKSPKA